jgi:ribosomal protein S18 acetylase RimI-like enzyme
MLHVEIAKLSDVEELNQIASKTFIETFAHLNSEENMKAYLENNLSVSKLTEELSNPHSIFFLAYIENELAAYLKLNLSGAQTEKDFPDALEIERIYVLNQFKGIGIGKKLIEKAIAIAQQNHLKYIWLGVWENNLPAIDFYRKFGFKYFGNHEFVLGNDVQKDILMQYNL